MLRSSRYDPCPLRTSGISRMESTMARDTQAALITIMLIGMLYDLARAVLAALGVLS